MLTIDIRDPDDRFAAERALRVMFRPFPWYLRLELDLLLLEMEQANRVGWLVADPILTVRP